MLPIATKFMTTTALLMAASSTFSAQHQCAVTSGATITPVIELYTSEGCSSCPPADKWASSLKDKGVVVQAFHVGYWDYIGWVDRFAAPAYTNRQREVAARNNLRSIYTPQVVFNGRDWPNWSIGLNQPNAREPARANITVQQLGADQFEASVTPITNLPGLQTAANWSAPFTIVRNRISPTRSNGPSRRPASRSARHTRIPTPGSVQMNFPSALTVIDPTPSHTPFL